jgi:hypothetical protein
VLLVFDDITCEKDFCAGRTAHQEKKKPNAPRRLPIHRGARFTMSQPKQQPNLVSAQKLCRPIRTGQLLSEGQTNFLFMESQPFFRDLRGGRTSEIGIPTHDRAEAAKFAADEEMQRIQALGRPHIAQPQLPQLKRAVLSEAFAQRVKALDDEIFKRGVAVNKERLCSLGNERFAQLIELDCKLERQRFGSNLDAASFFSVQNALGAFESPTVARRSMREQVSGAGKERDEVRRITDWQDLFKATHERQETLNAIYEFRRQFESLLLAQSMLERLSKDSRVRSRLFTGGRGRKVEIFNDDWLSVLEGSLTRVSLPQTLFHLVAWLSNEKAEPLSTLSLARAFFNVRSPSREQERVAQVVCDSFLLGYDGWPLWQRVGRETRTMQEQGRLSTWRTELARHFLCVTDFHAEIRAAFMQDVGYGYEAHRMLDQKGYRAFIDRIVQERLDAISSLLALGVDEVAPRTIVARFGSWLLVDTKTDLEGKRASICRQLAAAFPDSSFRIEFDEVQR